MIGIFEERFWAKVDRDGDGWACVGFENPNISAGDEEEKEWDLILPIPDPSTVPEFTGH